MFRRFRLLYVLIASNAIILLVLILRFNLLPPQIPLFYSKAVGEDQLADTWMILLLPLLMNFLYILNNILAKKYFNEIDLAQKIVHYLNIFIILGFVLIFVKIIFLIT